MEVLVRSDQYGARGFAAVLASRCIYLRQDAPVHRPTPRNTAARVNYNNNNNTHTHTCTRIISVNDNHCHAMSGARAAVGVTSVKKEGEWRM